MTYPIPDNALDDRLGFVGTSGAGKTYSAGTCVERLLYKKSRVLILDPLGVWFGLRLLHDGKEPSPFDVVIFGGPRGDLPINEHAGSLIGETCAGMKESAIIDLSELGTKASERRFMLAFITALYRRANKEPVHLIFDEADMFAPERLLDKEGEAAKLLGMMETIVRRGRIKGFIPWLISQRPAVLSKNVLSQVDGLASFKLTSSQDRKAIGAWVEGQADEGQWKTIYNELPTLERGTSVVWLPAHGVLKTVQFPEKETFDSSRAPKRGERKKITKLKPLNISALKERVAKVEAETKANDPAALRLEIGNLKRQLAKTTPKSTQKIDAPINKQTWREGQQAGFAEGWNEALDFAKKRIGKILGQAIGLVEQCALDASRASEELSRKYDALNFDDEKRTIVLKVHPAAVAQLVEHRPSKSNVAGSIPAGRSNQQMNGALPKGERKILIALAQYPDGCERDQLSILTGYKRSSRDAYVQRLREKGYAENSGTLVQCTEAGYAALGGDYEPLPTGDALREYWLSKLPEGERRILEGLVGAFPQAVERESLDEATGYKRSSRDAYIQRLKARRLVTLEGRSLVKAAQELFG